MADESLKTKAKTMQQQKSFENVNNADTEHRKHSNPVERHDDDDDDNKNTIKQ